MPDTVILNEGKLKLIAWLWNANPLTDLKVMTFKNDYVPVAGSVLADFTLSNWTGYADFDVVRANLSVPAIVGGRAKVNLAPPPSFVCTGGASQTVYGWVLFSDDDSVGLAARRFALPGVMSNGATLTLDPFDFLLDGFVP